MQPRSHLLIVLDIGAGRATVEVRGWRFADSFRAHGWNAEFVDMNDCSEQEILDKAKRVDAVYLVKIRSLRLMRSLKAQGSKVIFDLTDPLWEVRYRRGGWWDIDEILLLADAVFSENEYVCSYGRKYNARVISIPVCTQVERFAEVRKTAPPPPTDRVVIGWVGSPMTVKAIVKLMPVLEQVSRRHPQVEWRLLGVGKIELPEAKWARFSVVDSYDEHTMIREILAMHIGIYPPPEDLADYRIRGAHKALLYMTGGIAAVAQKEGDCATKIRDGETGMLASTPEEWVDRLSRLVSSPDLRGEIGKRAAAAVHAEHSLENVFRELQNALRLVIDSPPSPPPGILDRARARVPRGRARLEDFAHRVGRRARRVAQQILRR